MNLDQHIDDVARRLTEVEPTGQLRARVVERLGAQGGPPMAFRWLPALAGTFVVVAVAAWWTLRLVPGGPPARDDRPERAITMVTPETPSAVIVPGRDITTKTRPREHAPLSGPVAGDASLDIVRIQPTEVAIPLLDEITPVRIMPIPELVPISGGD